MRQVLRAGALGRPRGMGWRGRWEGGSGWGTHVNPWLIHVSVWQELGFKTEFVYETSGDEDNFYINYDIASYSNWHP